MPDVTIKSLLEAGVHFGHQTRRWNPKMKRFIFEERNGIHILDLQQTISQLNKAGQVLREIVLQGGSVLFVGTKKQAKETVYRAATRCGMFYVNERWLGGTLTNNRTIRKSIGRLRDLEAMSQNGTFEKLPKKEVSRLLREKAKLHKYLDGIKEMDGLPAALFVVDTRREKIAVAEAIKIGIPVLAMVDSTSDPDLISYPIPANDDAIKSITLISDVVSEYIAEAQNELYKSQPEAARVPTRAKPEAPREGEPPGPTPVQRPGEKDHEVVEQAKTVRSPDSSTDEPSQGGGTPAAQSNEQPPAEPGPDQGAERAGPSASEPAGGQTRADEKGS